MTMGVFKVITPEINQRTGCAHFLNFECHFATVDDLTAALNDGRLVPGTKLVTRHTEDRGVIEVLDRCPASIRREGVARIELPMVRLIEASE